MAQAKKPAARKKTSGSSRSGSNTRRKPSAAKQEPKKEMVEVGFGDYWHAFSKTRVFVPVMTILITAVLTGLDLLVAWNDYGRFFLFLGIELIAAAVIWLCIMIYSFNSEKKNREGGGEV